MPGAPDRADPMRFPALRGLLLGLPGGRPRLGAGAGGPVKPVDSVTPPAAGPSCRRTLSRGFKHTAVDVTQLFSLRENAIAKEPGSSYCKAWRCVSRLGLANGGLDSLESSPDVTLSRGAFSASSLVTPTRGLLPGAAWFPFATVIFSPPTPPHTASGYARRSLRLSSFAE